MNSIFALVLLSLFTQAHEHKVKKTGTVSLDSFASASDVHVLVTKTGTKGLELEYLRSNDGGANWSAPATIPTGPVNSGNRGNFPQVAAFKDSVAAVWSIPEKRGGGLGSAHSTDGGKTWIKGTSPIDDASVKSAAYLDLEADELGMIHAVWLDSRKKGPQGLRYARSKDHGKTWEKQQNINAKTCECCWNRIYANQNHLQTLYRAYDPRDMAISESKDSGETWSTLSTAGEFGWKIKGCPHMGGAMARAGKSTAEPIFSFVWTGKVGKPGMYVMKSTDLGKTWREPVQVGSQRANQGDIATTEKTVAMVWRDDADKNEGEVIRLQFSTDGGSTWKTSEIFAKKGARPSYPQIHATGDQFVVTWLSAEHGLSEWSAKTWRP